MICGFVAEKLDKAPKIMYHKGKGVTEYEKIRIAINFAGICFVGMPFGMRDP